MIGQTVSHYKIVDKLGEGGMGVVYKAEDLTLDRHVALKFLSAELSSDESAKKRFIREAKAASALEHPNICSIYEIDQAPDGRLFTVMPCYEGETLRERLEEGALDVDDALAIAAQVASALARAHEKGIVHRDVKPGNVMLTEGGRQAKLMDFGLVKRQDATKVTRTGMTVGTVAYMSPEQALGKETDGRTDVWSLGVMLFEMLTGRLPFRGDVEAALIYSILNEEPEAVSASRRDVPVEIENVVDKAIAKNLSERYQTAEEFLAALEEQREVLKLGGGGRGRLAIRRKARRRLLRIGIPALLAVAVVVLLVVFPPLEIEIKPKTTEAIARENSIVVLPFVNVMDPDDAHVDAYAITSLLTMGLRESEYMMVVSEGRVNDVLRQLGEEDRPRVSREVAEEVARRTGSNWILTGKLYQTEPNLVVTAEISNAVTGEVRGNPANVRGEEGETVLEIVDRLKAKLGKELALPPEAMEELDRSVSDVTTSSPEAYRRYLEGVRQENKLHWEDAIASYESAIEQDSTFAMVYLRMGHMLWLLCQEVGKCQPEKTRWCFEKARENSDRLSEIQRTEMEALEAMFQGDYQTAKDAMLEIVEKDPQEKRVWNMTGDITRVWLGKHQEAIGYYEKVIELDSTFASGLTYGWISLSANLLGDSEKAEWAATKYLTLAPEDIQANWVYGQYLLYHGKIEEAIGYFEKCEVIKPGIETSTLAQAYIKAGRYEQADSVYRRLIASPDMVERRWSRRNLACIPMAQGKLDRALGILDDGMAADRMEKQTDPWKHHLKARILMHQNRTEAAIRELETANRLTGNSPWSYSFTIAFLSRGGRVAEAEDSLQIFRTRIDAANVIALGMYQWSRGTVELARGEPDSAVVYLDMSVENIHRRIPWSGLPMRYSLAQAYLELERPAEALEAIAPALQYKYTYDVAHSILVAKAHYLAGQIYEQLGDAENAVVQYEEFLELWRDADPDLEEVSDARRRLALLK
jgi:tetratricopeptide (TPR) repeat protein